MFTMESDFFTWIAEETDKRDWSNNELGRRAGLSSGTISLVLSGQRNVTEKFCIAIAKAFGEKPQDVLRLAGLLPPSAGSMNDLSEDEGHLIEMYRQFHASDRPRVLRVVKGMLLTADEVF